MKYVILYLEIYLEECYEKRDYHREPEISNS